MIDINKSLNLYFSSNQDILDYFEYEESWLFLPIEDQREWFWNKDNEKVYYAKTRHELENEEDNYYDIKILYNHHITKNVCRTKDFTLIAVDYESDGNKSLMIFDNSLEIPNAST